MYRVACILSISKLTTRSSDLGNHVHVHGREAGHVDEGHAQDQQREGEGGVERVGQAD